MDGSKAPSAFWKTYQQARADHDQLTAWFTGGTYDGLGLVTGSISGNLELFELEGRAVAEKLLEALAKLFADHGLTELWTRIVTGYAETTPSGGLHILYWVAGTMRGNTKLASRPARPDELTADEQTVLAKHPGKIFTRVLIETRGEGGYVVVAPSGGRTHPTGKPWTLLTGGPATIATINEDERDAIHAIASLLDTMPAPATPPAPAPPQRQAASDGLRPGDDYANKTNWEDIIGTVFTRVAPYGRGWTWRRHGKTDGISATTGTRGDGDNLWVWTSSTEFEPEEPYTKFGAYTLLQHGNNFSAATSALRKQGYGGELPPLVHGDEDLASLIAPRADGTRVQGNLALATVTQIRPRAVADDGRHRIDLTLEPDAVTGIDKALNNGAIPDLYVRQGMVSQVFETDDGTGPRLIIRAVDADGLRQLLARHAGCYKAKTSKEGVSSVAPALPTVSVAKAVLTTVEWPGLDVLAGVTAIPLIRPDGTTLAEPGYDKATRLYHQPTVTLRDVPANPTTEQARQARAFLLDLVLADFCFDSPASRANFVALLMTPLLRLYLKGLPPLGVISATTRGSGKTLLTDLLRAAYSLTLKPWPKRDEEMGKVITATLADDTTPVICFDNVGPFDTVDHATLAALLTASEWSDRILGSSTTVKIPNDRMWLCTGNNVALGGDIASRSILIRLDPHTENPEERRGFAIDDMWTWLKEDTNRAELQWSLLVLARSWIGNGAQHDTTIKMRNFSSWA
ncbi:MAG: bifunctional DNA primase/polymerase, partial [Terracoccus sp.]